MNENQAFLNGEADAYYRRNAAHNAAYDINRDVVADMMLDLGHPQSIVDMGCSSGERLEALCRRYPGAVGLGVDASEEAIEAAHERTKREGLPICWTAQDWTTYRVDQGVNTIVTSFVWHWVARDKLYSAADTVHHSLRPGGYLIINDFDPLEPTWRPYHHLPDAQVWTYKQDYPALFLASGRYEKVAKRRYYYGTNPYVQDAEVCACTVLRRIDPEMPEPHS